MAAERTPIKVLLAEDHHVVRKAVAGLLEKEADIEVVGQVAETGTILDVVPRLQPDLLLLDASMPGPNVVEVTKKLRAQHPQMHILVLSAYDRREHVVGLLKAGAAGYVLKDDDPQDLLHAIRTVAQGEEWLTPRVAKILLESVRNRREKRQTGLTQRETDVLRLMATGATNEEIGDALHITVNTVKNHSRSIFRKLGVDSRVQAVVYALKHDLVSTSGDGDRG